MCFFWCQFKHKFGKETCTIFCFWKGKFCTFWNCNSFTSFPRCFEVMFEHRVGIVWMVLKPRPLNLPRKKKGLKRKTRIFQLTMFNVRVQTLFLLNMKLYLACKPHVRKDFLVGWKHPGRSCTLEPRLLQWTSTSFHGLRWTMVFYRYFDGGREVCKS